MEVFEEFLQKVAKEVSSKGTPAESHAAAKLCPDILGQLMQRKNAFSGEVDLTFIQKIFQLLRICFYSDQTRLQLLGLTFMQKCLEDERFNPKNFTGDARKAFPTMFVDALSELCLEGTDEIAVEILRVCLNFTCQPLWMQDPYAVMKIVTFCMHCSGLRRCQNVKIAASATNVQAVTSFCTAVLNESVTSDSVLPSDFQIVLTFVGDNLENLQNFSEDPKGIEVLRTTLLSIYTILQNTSKTVQHHPQFQEYVWRKITPALCHWLGKPAEMYMQTVARQVQAAAGLVSIADMDMIEIKLISQIFLDLAKTYARTDSMRCVLGSLLQRMMSVASVRQRLYTLNSLAELLNSPEFLSDLEGPNSQGNLPDTCLVAIIFETLAKLARIKHHEVETVCTKLALAYLSSLEHVAEGLSLKDDQVATLNKVFIQLADTTPISLDDIERNVDILMVKKRPQESIDLGDLTVPVVLPREDSLDAETVETPTSAAGVELLIDGEQLETPGPDAKPVFDFTAAGDVLCTKRTELDEQDSANRFIAKLVDAIPQLLHKISTIEVDEAMQQFASEFCEDEKNIFNGIPYLNADGVYVAAYQLLRFTVRARDMRYFTRRSHRPDLIPMSEKEFVSGVLGCGLLVYMSSGWIRQVYRVVVEKDLLSEVDSAATGETSPFVQVIRGGKLARYLVGRCWVGLQYSLQSVFLDLFSRKKLLTLKKDLTEEVLQLMCSALGGLQRYADLCARLRLYELCSEAYALLARVCCSSLYPQPALQSHGQDKSLLRLHPWNVLSIDVVLRRSLDMGSRNPDCWKAFFTCYLYLHRLETKFLINAKTSSLTKRELQDCSSTVADITTKFMGNAHTKASESLDADHSYMALGALLNALDCCFVDATKKLNLSNLCNFIRTLGDASLRVTSERVMMMERLTNLVILSAKCGRPLLHVMIIWASAIPFLYQAAASRTPVVSEKAVVYIHAMVSTLTSTLSENPHFHFNELQLKPFESLICSQVCSVELQELIVYSLCNLVETSKSDIRSGWKSLFCTVRGIQIDGKSGNLLQAVSDVYEAFLNSDNVRIFSSSLWECIQSLVKLYRTALDLSTTGTLSPGGQNALKYIRHSMRLLFSLDLMPDFVGLAEADRLRAMGFNFPKMDHILPIAPTIDSLNEHLLEEIYTWIPGEQTRSELRHCILSKSAPETGERENVQAKLLEWDAPKGILTAATSVLDGFVNGWSTSWNALNNESVETVIEILRDAADKKRAHFSMVVVSDIIAPVVQQMLRRKNPRHDGPFQQLIGMLTELVADICDKHHHEITQDPNHERHLDCLFHTLAECCLSGHEATVKLSISCFRHLVTRLCTTNTPAFRPALVRGIVTILHVTFSPTYELMSCYNPWSKSLYGDTGHVKIAITNDSTLNEMQRMRQNALQVFLTDDQKKDESNTLIDPESNTSGKSFTFLIYPSELDYHVSSDMFIKRIPLDRLVQGLVGHEQMVKLAEQVLKNHCDPKLNECLTGLDRLILLCACRQSYTLASDFNHLSGLKFLIKRVLASSHAVNLYRLSSMAGCIHSMETLRVCAMQRSTFGVLQPRRQHYDGQLNSDIRSAQSAAFFAEYARIWIESIVAEYIGHSTTTVSSVSAVVPISVHDTEPSSSVDSESNQEGASELVEVTLSDPALTRTLSSTSVTVAALKSLITVDSIRTLMEKLEGMESAGKDDKDAAVNGAGTPPGRKNPFRESVVASSELPSDCALELQTAIEEDNLARKAMRCRPLMVFLDLPGFSAADKLAVAALCFYLSRAVLADGGDTDLELLQKIRRFFVWFEELIK
ncbi:Brefeldin A-inhibited guanine nucleotide-exchange protein 3 [Hypsibius exemplaris]|uniref:Brefeldin A-inhibited guanine nucleotide-exchange protein 3 n=1 Tax=Hypsibius exemplaris TaxID=2072580 RepID=A0A1W0XAA9_HYPEX|nr:Brefeldin A-inhibited guanine nucleotide-exchange protein 3 [Hypsibius exemplaris]